MADPQSVTLTALRAALAHVGVVLDEDFVSLEVRENALTVQRLVRTESGMPACLPNGGVQCVGQTITVVAETPPAPEE
ncbi:hypothetical protein [Micromonospora endophytica]|uniref:Uncharacterized protein n=1 Tax=Micromonospora endophytica TaxID=515350 RepID=A0A2W2DEQ1_9ACTN|nr:hypothetical protein [Micromonospora endophytica]PZF98327.1 hypothetical protein C1I93_09145 [Micromonospora endophytica]RIW42915.1 hypothetical protein D3H59_22080 [Micromonospora endophytica]BCJ61561.1 hypothetical protein Jiend_49830 [Micromonospora endophytica]